MTSPPGNLDQTAIVDSENAELLSNNQLLSRIERYLNILQQRMHLPGHAHPIDPNQVERLLTKKRMLAKIRSILEQFHDLVSSGHVRGFVYGLIGNDRTYTAASDNLRSWWKNVINFDKNGPWNLTIPNSQTLSLQSLNDLQDTSLSSLVSTLMTVCTPSQRLFPFEAGVPVGWWPTGTEEWWAEMGFSENLEPPPYRKPHDLKKLWKVAVMTAIIKNIQPNFELMRDIVAQARTLQSKMSSRENDIWLAVLRGEELAMSQKLRLSASSNGESSGATSMVMAPEPELAPASSGSALASQGPIEKSNADGASGREPAMAPVSRNRVLAQGPVDVTACGVEGNGASKRKRISSPKPKLVPLSVSSALAQGRVEMGGADGESNGANRGKRIATSEPEIMQGQIETDAIVEESSGRRQKLKGIAVDEPVGLLLPDNWHQGNFHTGLVDAAAPNSDHQFARSLCQPSHASARNFQHPSSNHQLSPMPIAAAGSQWPNMLPGNFHPVSVDSPPYQIQNLVRGNFHAGMANAGAVNNNLFAPPSHIQDLHLPSSTLSVSYLQYLNNNNLQPTPMSVPAFSMPTPQPAEYYGVPSSLGSNNICQVNSSNWARPNVQAPLARLVPNCPYSLSHGVPVCLSQRNQLVQAEYSTLSIAAGISTPNASVSNHQNQSQQAKLMSTNQGGELMSNNIHQQSAQNQAPRAENNIMSTGAAAANDSMGIQAETCHAATNDDPLEQLQSGMNEDMTDLESLFEGYMRQLASGGI